MSHIFQPFQCPSGYQVKGMLVTRRLIFREVLLALNAPPPDAVPDGLGAATIPHQEDPLLLPILAQPPKFFPRCLKLGKMEAGLWLHSRLLGWIWILTKLSRA
jgi:hypothetical protein